MLQLFPKSSFQVNLKRKLTLAFSSELGYMGDERDTYAVLKMVVP